MEEKAVVQTPLCICKMREISNIENLQEIKTIELQILNAVVDFCEAHDLTYYLIGGTLIGAARHAGFIPWDDDIDILMPRSSFGKFIEQFPASADGLSPDGKFRLGYLNTTPNYNRSMAKVYRTNTLLRETDRKNDFKEGLFVDIWTLDGTPGNKLKRSAHLNRIRMLNLLLSSAIKYDYSGRSGIKKAIFKLLMPLTRAFVDPTKLAAHIGRVCSKYRCEDSAFFFIPVAPHICYYKAEWFSGEKKTLLFEGRDFAVPPDYDKVLRKQFGDYMQLPPPADRKPHHLFTVYINDDSMDMEG